MFTILIVNNVNSYKASDDPNEMIIFDLNDTNFDEKVNSGKDNPWFLIFYINSCPHCKNVNAILNNIPKNINLIQKKNVNIGRINCDSNMFSCHRFKILNVPYMVTIDKNYMYEFKEYPSKENIIKFINTKNENTQGLEIPNVIGYIEFFYKSLEEGVRFVNGTIENYLKNNLKIDIAWKSEYTIFLLTFVLISIILVEYFILILLCKIPNNQDNNESEDLKEEEDEKKKNKSNEEKKYLFINQDKNKKDQ